MISKTMTMLSTVHADSLEAINQLVEELVAKHEDMNSNAFVKVTVNPDPKQVAFIKAKHKDFFVTVHLINKRQLRETVIEILEKHRGKSLISSEIADHINFNGVNFDSEVAGIVKNLIEEGMVDRNSKTLGYQLII